MPQRTTLPMDMEDLVKVSLEMLLQDAAPDRILHSVRRFVKSSRAKTTTTSDFLIRCLTSEFAPGPVATR